MISFSLSRFKILLAIPFYWAFPVIGIHFPGIMWKKCIASSSRQAIERRKC